MQALLVPAFILVIEAETIATILGIGFLAALALAVNGGKTDEEIKAVAKAKGATKNNKDDEDELHNSWDLHPTQKTWNQGKTRRDMSSKKKWYFYEKDMLHKNHQEIYTSYGNKGVHIGTCAMNGGPLLTGPVNGRTINLS